MRPDRRAQAIAAIEDIQKRSIRLGLDKMSLKEINRIIKDVRKARREAHA